MPAVAVFKVTDTWQDEPTARLAGQFEVGAAKTVPVRDSAPTVSAVVPVEFSVAVQVAVLLVRTGLGAQLKAPRAAPATGAGTAVPLRATDTEPLLAVLLATVRVALVAAVLVGLKVTETLQVPAGASVVQLLAVTVYRAASVPPSVTEETVNEALPVLLTVKLAARLWPTVTAS